LVAIALHGQTVGGTNIGGTSPMTIPFTNAVFQTPPILSPITNTGTPGSTTYCYWIVVDTYLGNTAPQGPACTSTANATLSGSNFDVVAWTATPQPTPFTNVPPYLNNITLSTYDVLRTTNTTAPTGACNCAVVTATSSLTVNDQANALNAYTVNTLVTDGLSGHPGPMTMTNPGHLYGTSGTWQSNLASGDVQFQAGTGVPTVQDRAGVFGGGGPIGSRGGIGADAPGNSSGPAAGTGGEGGDADIHGGPGGNSILTNTVGNNVGGLGGHAQMQGEGGGQASGSTATNQGGGGGQNLNQSGPGGAATGPGAQCTGGAGGMVDIQAWPGGLASGCTANTNGAPGLIRFWVSTGTGAVGIVGTINGSTARTSFDYQINSGKVGGTSGAFGFLGSTSGSGSLSTNATATNISASIPLVTPAGTAAAPGLAVSNTNQGFFSSPGVGMSATIVGSESTGFAANETRMLSTGRFTFCPSTTMNCTIDTGISRSGIDIVALGNGASGDTTAKVKASGYMSLGTKFTTNNGCTDSATAGGATAGTFTTGSTSCTEVITMGDSATAPNGWSCTVVDITTLADVTNPHQTTSNATTATIVTGTVVVGDKIQFSCIGY
jgi:hypothetical protein